MLRRLAPWGTSLVEYITAYGHWGWIVLMGYIAGGLGAWMDITNAQAVPVWVWIVVFMIGTTVVPFIAFHQVRKGRDDLKAFVDDRQRRREIADRLGKFLGEADRLTGEILRMPEDTDRNELVGPVLSWQGEVYRYIATYCGLAEAELFQIVNFMEAPPHIHEFPSKNHAEATRQLLPRMGNLRKIIDEYRKSGTPTGTTP